MSQPTDTTKSDIDIFRTPESDALADHMGADRAAFAAMMTFVSLIHNGPAMVSPVVLARKNPTDSH